MAANARIVKVLVYVLPSTAPNTYTCTTDDKYRTSQSANHQYILKKKNDILCNFNLLFRIGFHIKHANLKIYHIFANPKNALR